MNKRYVRKTRKVFCYLCKDYPIPLISCRTCQLEWRMLSFERARTKYTQVELNKIRWHLKRYERYRPQTRHERMLIAENSFSAKRRVYYCKRCLNIKERRPLSKCKECLNLYFEGSYHKHHYGKYWEAAIASKKLNIETAKRINKITKEKKDEKANNKERPSETKQRKLKARVMGYITQGENF